MPTGVYKRKPLTEKHKHNISIGGIGRIPHNKNKTNIEMYGEEKAKEISKKISEGNMGHKGWNEGLTKDTDERLKKLSEKMKGNIPWNKDNGGYSQSDATRKKRSENSFGENNSFYGYHHTDEQKQKWSEDRIGILSSPKTKQKQRESAIEKVKNIYGGKFPSYNKNACKVFDKLNIELGLNLRHAENGGEVQIIGYLIDAIDFENNLIIEYDEKYHNNKKQKLKDEIRQSNLIKETGFAFVRINENNNKYILE